MRLVLGALGAWLTGVFLVGATLRLLGGSTDSVRAVLPDLWLLRAGFGIPDAPLALSLLHGLLLLALAARLPRVRRPGLALLLLAAVAINGLGLEVSGFRLARQVLVRQRGWSDPQIRDDWYAWQGFDPADFARLRAAVGPRESVTFRIADTRGSEHLARFLGFALLPSPSYFGTPPARGAEAWVPPPPTDWVVELEGSRVKSLRRTR